MNNIAYIVLLALFLISCKSESFDIENLNGNRIDVLGHAGMGISDLYPSNSAESILNCLNIGATGTEVDVQMTSDGVLVLFHDQTLEDKTSLQGVVHSKTWDEIKSAQYDQIPYSNYSLVRLSDLFKNIENPEQYTFSLDIKLYTETSDYNNFLNQYTDALVELFSEFNLYNHVYLESHSTEFISLTQAKSSNIDFYYYAHTFEEGFSKALTFNLKGISISSIAITENQIKEAHDAGLFVVIWNTQSKNENIEAIHKQPDIIITDRVKYLVDLLTEQDLIN